MVKGIERNVFISPALKRILNDFSNVAQSKIDKWNVVPSKYHIHHAITEFIEYIDTLQAKTLEECITLYHTNRRHRERIEAML